MKGMLGGITKIKFLFELVVLFQNRNTADNVRVRALVPPATTVTAFYSLCQDDLFAKTLLYSEVPKFYTWNASAKKFQRRKQVHQVINLSEICLTPCSIKGYVELTLISHKENLQNVKINAQQIEIEKVLIDGSKSAPFTCINPLQETSKCKRRNKTRSLKKFLSQHSKAAKRTDGDRENGELVIDLSGVNLAKEQEFLIRIDFSLVEPKHGIHCVVPPCNDQIAEFDPPHLFTYTHGNTARAWFPCIDSYHHPCTWDLQYTVGKCLQVISSGELIGVAENEGHTHTFNYKVTTPVPAPNVGFAVGPFLEHTDPERRDLRYYCLPNFLPLLESTVSHVANVVGFYEETLREKLPALPHKLVFVDELDCDALTFSSLTVLSLSLLHTTNVIEQKFETMKVMLRVVAELYFGRYILPVDVANSWVVEGIAGYIHGLSMKAFFGNSFYVEWIWSAMREVVEYEKRWGGIVLSGSKTEADSDENHTFLSKAHRHILSPMHLQVIAKKAHLVTRMIEFKIGQPALLKVLNAVLTAAADTTQTHSIRLSADSLAQLIFTKTGFDISNTLEQWVYAGGHAKIIVSPTYSSQRNAIELKLRQNSGSSRGFKLYNGSLVIQVQELEGSFKHTVPIKDELTTVALPCKSKLRKNMKRTVPLWTNEEVEINLSNVSDTPVLWIQADPNLTIIGEIKIEQMDYQWQLQLQHERDVIAQLQAINALNNYLSQTTKLALIATIENDRLFYKVRQNAIFCISNLWEKFPFNENGVPYLLELFWKYFARRGCTDIVRPNDFSNLQLYFLQKAIVEALGGLKNIDGTTSPQIVNFLLDLLKFNDNTQNVYLDSYYKAIIIDALGNTLTPASAETNENLKLDDHMPFIREISERITSILNWDINVLPSYKHSVTIACLKVIRKLQKYGYIQSKVFNESSIFMAYAERDHPREVRVAALECFIDYTKSDGHLNDLGMVLNIVETDKDPSIRRAVIECLIKNPPFTSKHCLSRLNMADQRERLWKNIKYSFALKDCITNNFYSFSSSSEGRLMQSYMVDLYYILYGIKSKPSESHI